MRMNRGHDYYNEKKALDYWTNSPCQNITKCIEKRMENMHIYKMLEFKELKHTIPIACVCMKDFIISLCFYDFLSWQCVLAGIGTCEHRLQMEMCIMAEQLHEHRSSKYDEFHFSFSIAQFYESNLISHVFVREIPWAQVHFLIKSHEWCLESFCNCTSYDE